MEPEHSQLTQTLHLDLQSVHEVKNFHQLVIGITLLPKKLSTTIIAQNQQEEMKQKEK
uniref:Sister chromatid cohesion 1 protein 4 isoform X1 n=1 Tax=Rhizophora mucronata TaxID=61149 RepID=A0A2P2MQ67_RHIMU